MVTKEKEWNVGIYCRLSKEEGSDVSQSIQHQKEILLDYIKSKEWKFVNFYIDDGYSGTDFDRPGFSKMLYDIEFNKINLVLTKDLSRLGRNYIKTGYYIENYFPEHNIRYVSLNDNYDSLNNNAIDLSPFKNFINEWYAKDISNKIRFVLDNKAKNGVPRNTVFPIYGYMYNEKYERIPDPETAPIVKLIYKKYVEEGSSVKVARYLKEQKIRIPRYYNAIKYGYNKEKVLAMSEEQLINWRADGVRDILSRVEYLGTYITAQSKSVSFKDKRRYQNKNCYVFENRYEALIDRETWNIANNLMKRTRSSHISPSFNIFKGIVVCSCCNTTMKFVRWKQKDKFYCTYYCSNPNCSCQYRFSKEALETFIVKKLIEIKNMFIGREKEFIKFSKDFNIEKRVYEYNKNINDIQSKINRVYNIVERLYQDYIEGIMSKTTFECLSIKYMDNLKEYNSKIETIKKVKEEFKKTNNLINAQLFLKKLSEIDKKNAKNFEFLHFLIKKIKIKEKLSRKRFAKDLNNFVEICYNNCDEIIKEFTDEKYCSNICKTVKRRRR